jgi:hypothetical protein
MENTENTEDTVNTEDTEDTEVNPVGPQSHGGARRGRPALQAERSGAQAVNERRRRAHDRSFTVCTPAAPLRGTASGVVSHGYSPL